jgi:hypothetical protein
MRGGRHENCLTELKVQTNAHRLRCVNPDWNLEKDLRLSQDSDERIATLE